MSFCVNLMLLVALLLFVVTVMNMINLMSITLLLYTHRNKFSRLIMPLALSRGILLRPRREPSTVLGLGLYLHLWVCEYVLLVNNIPVF